MLKRNENIGEDPARCYIGALATEVPVSWTLTDAKDNLSELVERAAMDGPQTIAVDGRDTAVVLSLNPHRDRASKPTFKALLKALPPLDGVDLSRDPRPSRDIEL